MKIERTKLPGVLLITPDRFGDDRGYLQELVNKQYAHDVKYAFYSTSDKGTVRGLHYQYGAAKLVSVVRGSIHEIALDMETGEWEGFTLTADKGEQLLIPAGYAAGFQALEDDTVYLNLMNRLYDPYMEGGFSPHSANWPQEITVISDRDRKAPKFKLGESDWGNLEEKITN